MNRYELVTGRRWKRLDTRSDLVVDGAVRWRGFDVLNRGVWSIHGAHVAILEHLRERAPVPGGAR